jgi:hypothetical protein
MPKTPIDYSNTMFYKIVCNDLNIKDCYVGHTTNFKQRKKSHKQHSNSPDSPDANTTVYKFIRNNGGWANFTMVLIETITCANSLEAFKVERQHIESLYATLNNNIPSRSKAERYLDNKESISIKGKEIRDAYPDKFKERNKSYYEKNRDKILERVKLYEVENRARILEKCMCECGMQFTRTHKLRHQRSNFHQQYVLSHN